MDTNARKPVFDAVDALLPGVWNIDGTIELMNRICDLHAGAATPRPSKAKGRQINRAGELLIQSFEGCELEAYLDIAGVPTIGWGHTGPEVHLGMVITQEAADRLFDEDTDRFEAAVDEMAPGCTDNQFAALVSFAYNLGEGALKSSTLLRLHRSGDFDAAADQFQRWNKARVNGKLVVVKGLTRRRAAEAALYRSVS